MADAGSRTRSAANDDEWLPPVTGGKGGRRWGRRLLAVLLILVLLPLVYGVALALHGSNSIERVPVEGLTPAATTTNVLIVGSDSRADLTPEERNELTTGGDFGDERTDTILLLVADGNRVALLSFPRDLWVERCDGNSQRINTAVQVGGLDCLAQTITATSGIGVDHVVQVSFGGFVGVVEAVGGVELCLERAIADRDAGIDLPAGCQTLGGADALGYVRVRKIDDDLKRIERQQEFLSALAGRVASPSTILAPWRAWPTAGAIGNSLTADEGLGPVELASLGLAARGLATGQVVRATVPTTPETINGAAVLLEAADAQTVYDAFRTGSVLETIESRDTSADPRADTRVVILNGAGVGGAAAATADGLTALGYPEPRLGNAERTRITTVQHPPQLQAEAARLADDIAGAIGVRPTLRAGADGDAVTLVLGTDITLQS